MTPRTASQPGTGAYVALAFVCFFWGTTYLGIRIALESMSPAVLMSVRYVLSGGVMLLGAWLMGATLPRGRELWITALCGVVNIGLGTGSLAYAEQWIPSALAALIITTQPFWMVGVEAAWGGERLQGHTLRGMLIGLAGALLLLGPGLYGGQATGVSSASLIAGFAALQFGAFMWSVGSIGQRKLHTRAHPFVSGAVQQLATGIAFVIPALLENRRPTWTAQGIGAIVYLAIFGAIIGYSAYIYSMTHLPVSLVSIYTYVNPVVAVALGWWWYREPFGWRETLAMGVIFTGVAVVKRGADRQTLAALRSAAK